MLIIRRKPHESVRITCPDGTQILVAHISCEGQSARIGFEAPEQVRIERLENRDDMNIAPSRSKRQIRRDREDGYYGDADVERPDRYIAGRKNEKD